MPKDNLLYDAGQQLPNQVYIVASISGKPVIPATNAAVVRHYANIFRSRGAPIEQLLENAGIRPDYLDIPDTVVPLKNAFRFAELACHSLQTEHLGLNMGLASSLADFGAYGRALQTATTLGGYLKKGVALFNTLTTGEQLWLSEHGPKIRLNIASPGDVGLGMYQSHLSTIAVTVAVCRKAIGPAWSPDEIRLVYRSRENIPQVDLFAESRILTGFPHSYVSIPRAAMALRLPQYARVAHNQGERAAQPLPLNLIGLAEKQIEALTADGRRFHIESVADSLAISKRTLQRALANEGLTYSQLLSAIRIRRASSWLDHSDKPIIEIALELGYTDASNFARTFRRHTGMSPRTFRNTALQPAREPGAD